MDVCAFITITYLLQTNIYMRFFSYRKTMRPLTITDQYLGVWCKGYPAILAQTVHLNGALWGNHPHQEYPCQWFHLLILVNCTSHPRDPSVIHILGIILIYSRMIFGESLILVALWVVPGIPYQSSKGQYSCQRWHQRPWICSTYIQLHGYHDIVQDVN